jgi:ion channel-forming bestrophin family protein
VQRTPHKLRATIVELWLKRLIDVAARRGHMSPVNANMLQLKIAQLPTLYTTVFNIANVPIPFNYMQYLQFLITAYMMLYTFVIVPRSELYTPLWVFVWGTFLFTADQVAMEIECPFGLDANDIDLEARLLQIEEELTVLVRSQYYFVSGGKPLPQMYTERGHASAMWDHSTHIGSASHSHSHASGSGKRERIKESFSFHQVRSEDQPALASHDSLPEINEFTALIASASIAASPVATPTDYGAAPGLV